MDYESRVLKAKELIENADYIVIGAGAGLSEAAGFHYGGERFDTIFADFKEKYGITDMYSGSFYPFESEEEKWAYWARMIQCNVYDTSSSLLYQTLYRLVEGKEYFVVTTNADNQFMINGFDPNRYFEVQGNYIYLQCSKGCHRKVYYNEDIIRKMVDSTKDCRIPGSLVPVCPICGESMDVHVRKDKYFVETRGWKHYQKQYETFLKKACRHKVVFLEFGVGFNTPTIIRYPFEQMVYQYKNANLIRFNKDYAFCMRGNEDNVISFNEDIMGILNQLMEVNNGSKRIIRTDENKEIISSI